VSDAGSVFLLTSSAPFPIVDLLAGSPIFLAMTQGYSPETRRVLALRVALNSLILVVASYFVGALILIRDMLRLKSMSSGSLIRRDRLIGSEFTLFAEPHIRTRFACPFLDRPGQSICRACGAAVDNSNLLFHFRAQASSFYAVATVEYRSGLDLGECRAD